MSDFFMRVPLDRVQQHRMPFLEISPEELLIHLDYIYGRASEEKFYLCTQESTRLCIFQIIIFFGMTRVFLNSFSPRSFASSFLVAQEMSPRKICQLGVNFLKLLLLTVSVPVCSTVQVGGWGGGGIPLLFTFILTRNSTFNFSLAYFLFVLTKV